MVIYWATKLRGFLKHMSEHMDGVEFVSNDGYYEVSGMTSKLKSKLIRSRLFDPVGLFQVINVADRQCDYYGSFNRFLNADKPYFLYLENPTALYHYSLGRLRFAPGRKRFARCLADPNLKYIICMADACRDTFEKINIPVPQHVKMATIRPFVPRNPHISPEKIRQQSQNEVLECLFCVQAKRFITKGGLDVVEAVRRLRNAGHNIHLTVITGIGELDADTLEQVNSCDGVTLLDFKFSYSELEQIYANTNVLLQPSSDDSCSLTILEAMKGGCAVIASNLYAFPEMVEENGNGYLLEPKFRIFTKDNIPNPACWPHKEKRRQAKKKNEAFVRSIEETILTLHTDREKLCAFALRSLELADTKFGEQTICDQWKDVWNTLAGE